MNGNDLEGLVRKSRAELSVELLKTYRVPIVLGVTSIGIIGYAVGIDLPTVEIPLSVKVFVLSVLLSGLLGFAPVSRIIRYLHDPPKRYIVSLGFHPDREAGIWELSPGAWEEVDIVEDELYQWSGTTWPTYEAEWFDPETMVAGGTWRGSEPDSELLRKEKKVEELREKIEADANTSIDTEIQIASKVRQAVKEIGQAIIDEHASATMYEGDRVADVLTDIRKDVEDDTGDPTPQRNGEKPVRQQETEALEALADLADVDQEAPADD
jgi:hypothetical protein